MKRGGEFITPRLFSCGHGDPGALITGWAPGGWHLCRLVPICPRPVCAGSALSGSGSVGGAHLPYRVGCPGPGSIWAEQSGHVQPLGDALPRAQVQGAGAFRPRSAHSAWVPAAISPCTGLGARAPLAPPGEDPPAGKQHPGKAPASDGHGMDKGQGQSRNYVPGFGGDPPAGSTSGGHGRDLSPYPGV